MRFSESLAAELRPHGLAVFAMGPGTVRTAMSERSLNSPEGRRWIPGFGRIFEEGMDVPLERPSALARELLSGAYDALSGLLIAPQDDLAAILTRIDEVRAKDHYTLRAAGFPNALTEKLAAMRRQVIFGPTIART